MKKLAASVAAALLSTTMLSACSALSQAPTVVSEESSLHHDTDGSSAAVPGSESSEAAHSDSASGGRLADILERGYIEVATEPYFAPNEFIDPSKQGTASTSAPILNSPDIYSGETGCRVPYCPSGF